MKGWAASVALGALLATLVLVIAAWADGTFRTLVLSYPPGFGATLARAALAPPWLGSWGGPVAAAIGVAGVAVLRAPPPPRDLLAQALVFAAVAYAVAATILGTSWGCGSPTPAKYLESLPVVATIVPRDFQVMPLEFPCGDDSEDERVPVSYRCALSLDGERVLQQLVQHRLEDDLGLQVACHYGPGLGFYNPTGKCSVALVPVGQRPATVMPSGENEFVGRDDTSLVVRHDRDSSLWFVDVEFLGVPLEHFVFDGATRARLVPPLTAADVHAKLAPPRAWVIAAALGAAWGSVLLWRRRRARREFAALIRARPARVSCEGWVELEGGGPLLRLARPGLIPPGPAIVFAPPGVESSAYRQRSTTLEPREIVAGSRHEAIDVCRRKVARTGWALLTVCLTLSAPLASWCVLISLVSTNPGPSSRTNGPSCGACARTR